MSFLRVGSEIDNGEKSEAYVFGSSHGIEIHITEKAAKERNTNNKIVLSFNELIAVAQSIKDRGWLK